MNYYHLIRPLLFTLPPEKAHKVAFFALQYNFLPNQKLVPSGGRLSTDLWGINFSNPVGLAAGFDKNASAVEPLLAQGFGFVEVGTVTPRFQSGNEQPRLFRLTRDKAIINRLGNNNDGSEPFLHNLQHWQKRRGNGHFAGVFGANIYTNSNKEGDIEEYISLLKKIYEASDYITVNISCPNTPDAREMQNSKILDPLLTAINEAKTEYSAGTGKNVPILIKISPDLSEGEQENMAELFIRHNIDGMVIANTSTSRDDLKSSKQNETGGLSGQPLFEKSTKVISNMYKFTENIPIIGVGGISSGDDAYTKIKAGASLVQIYTAIIYQGFGVISQINQRLLELLSRDGLENISQAVGLDHK